MSYADRQFLIVAVSEIPKLDFAQILQTSPDTLRRSLDATHAVIKWEGQAPDFIQNLATAQGPYDYAEIAEILAGPAWTDPTPRPAP